MPPRRRSQPKIMQTTNACQPCRVKGSRCAAQRPLLCGITTMNLHARSALAGTDTPNSAAAPTATPIATARTASVNSSRLPLPTTCVSSHGTARRPTMTISPMKPPTLSSVTPTAHASPVLGAELAVPVLPMAPRIAGRSTSAKTTAMSSTTSQPTTIRPSMESSNPRDSSTRSTTTVEATDSARPKMNAADRLHPHVNARAPPSAVATTICSKAPGNATRRTRMRSPGEKCRPTPNISRMTPTSASCDARPMSPTKPGELGPSRIPASR